RVAELGNTRVRLGEGAGRVCRSRLLRHKVLPVMTTLPSPTRTARRIAFPPNWPARIGLVVLVPYVIYASQILDVTWARFLIGIEQGARFVGRMFPPNVAADKLQLLYSGMIESLQIAILATVFGIVLSLPLGLAAARNLSIAP